MPDIKLAILLVQRSWQALSGLVTVILITHYLSPELQGWYYSFLSIAALYTVFDLGLSTVLVQMSAQLFVGLRWKKRGDVEGANSRRFRSFAVQSMRHHAFLAMAFSMLVIPAGLLFFAGQSHVVRSQAEWIVPWITLGVCTSAVLLTLPLIALVEGSGKIVEVYVLRLTQGVVGSIACWTTLNAGGQLWAATMVPATACVIAGIWFAVRWPALLSIKNGQSETHSRVRWMRDVWPLQWRVGMTWISAYLTMQILTPILFFYHGAVVAGQMGLSLTIANTLGLFAQSWIARHIPYMAQAAFARDIRSLDRLFQSDFVKSTLFYVVCASGLVWARMLLDRTVYGERVLEFWPFVSVLIIVFANHVIASLAAYLRSFKQEPLVWVSVAGAVVVVPLIIWAARTRSVEQVVNSVFLVQVAIALPLSVLLWKKSGDKWKKSL